uniref:Uncharacterized protein n=1 Tax=Oryza brachyantha TaxID=4533 RepID=J3N6I8_ORYBR
LVAALAGSITLQPGEVATSVHVQKVRFRWVPNVHSNIAYPTGYTSPLSRNTAEEADDSGDLAGVAALAGAGANGSMSRASRRTPTIG